MKTIGVWKVVAVAIALSVLGGCSLVHSELGTAFKEDKSYKEYWGKSYPGYESGNRHAYVGR